MSRSKNARPCFEFDYPAKIACDGLRIVPSAPVSEGFYGLAGLELLKIGADGSATKITDLPSKELVGLPVVLEDNMIDTLADDSSASPILIFYVSKQTPSLVHVVLFRQHAEQLDAIKMENPVKSLCLIRKRHVVAVLDDGSIASLAVTPTLEISVDKDLNADEPVDESETLKKVVATLSKPYKALKAIVAESVYVLCSRKDRASSIDLLAYSRSDLSSPASVIRLADLSVSHLKKAVAFKIVNDSYIVIAFDTEDGSAIKAWDLKHGIYHAQVFIESILTRTIDFCANQMLVGGKENSYLVNYACRPVTLLDGLGRIGLSPTDSIHGLPHDPIAVGLDHTASYIASADADEARRILPMLSGKPRVEEFTQAFFTYYYKLPAGTQIDESRVASQRLTRRVLSPATVSVLIKYILGQPAFFPEKAIEALLLSRHVSSWDAEGLVDLCTEHRAFGPLHCMLAHCSDLREIDLVKMLLFALELEHDEARKLALAVLARPVDSAFATQWLHHANITQARLLLALLCEQLSCSAGASDCHRPTMAQIIGWTMILFDAQYLNILRHPDAFVEPLEQLRKSVLTELEQAAAVEKLSGMLVQLSQTQRVSVASSDISKLESSAYLVQTNRHL